VHLSIDGWRIKTVPSRLSAVDLARLRQNGACPAGPPPAGNAPGALAATSCVEVQRLVNAAGIITLGNQVIQVGSPLAGQRARIRLEPAPSAATPRSRRQQQRAAAFCSRQPPNTAHRHLADGYPP